MDDLSRTYCLPDAELGVVTGGRGGGYQGGGNSGTIVEIVEISIGEIVTTASGNSTATVNLSGIGDATTANRSAGGSRRR